MTGRLDYAIIISSRLINYRKGQNYGRIGTGRVLLNNGYRDNASNGIINKGLNRMKRNQIGYFSCLEFLIFWAVIIGGFLIITGKLF